jgi:hypothetical protein
MRRPYSMGVAAHGTRVLHDHEVLNKNGSPSFNPLKLLMTALGYGKSIWAKVNDLPLSDALPIVDLIFLLEEHIQNLITLCKLDYTSSNASDDSIISDLLHFYNRKELPTQSNKRGHSLPEILIKQADRQSSSVYSKYSNYYELLAEITDEEIPLNFYSFPLNTNQKMVKSSEIVMQASFPEDLSIAEVTITSIRHHQNVTAMEEDVEIDPHSTPLQDTPQGHLQLLPPKFQLQLTSVSILFVINMRHLPIKQLFSSLNPS